MNQSTGGGRYFSPDDFADHRPIPWMALLAALVASTIFCSAAFFYGDARGFVRGKAWQAAQPQPARAACPGAGLTQWQCTSQERKEYVNTCANRLYQEMRIPAK
jgi:hypothetical protein